MDGGAKKMNKREANQCLNKILQAWGEVINTTEEKTNDKQN